MGNKTNVILCPMNRNEINRQENIGQIQAKTC